MTFWLGFDLERQHKKKSKLNISCVCVYKCSLVCDDDLMGQMSWFINIRGGGDFLLIQKWHHFLTLKLSGGEKKIRGIIVYDWQKNFLSKSLFILVLKMHHFVECHQKVRPALDDLELSMEHRGNDRMNSIGSRRGVQIRFFCCSTVV